MKEGVGMAASMACIIHEDYVQQGGLVWTSGVDTNCVNGGIKTEICIGLELGLWL